MAQVQYHMLYDVAKQNDSIVNGCMLVLKIIKHYLNNFLTKVMKLFYVKINVATCIKNVVANVMIFNKRKQLKMNVVKALNVHELLS